MSSLIETQLEVLLLRDEQGRLRATRDPKRQTAPRIFLGRSEAANVWGIRADVDPATSEQLAQLLAAEPRLARPSAENTAACRARVRRLLDPVAHEHSGPGYVLPEGLRIDERAREVEYQADADWLESFPWLAESFEAIAPVVIAFDAGQPAAVCHSPRGRTAAAAEAGVETLERFRGRGLATAAVTCWARAIQRSGRLALYSTTWNNSASQGVARRLCGELYGDNWHLR